MTEQKRLRMSLEHVPRQVKMKFSQNTYYSNLICPTFRASEIFCSLWFSLINAKGVVSFVCKLISFSLKSCLWSYMVFWHLCDFIVIFKTNKLPIKVFKMIIIVWFIHFAFNSSVWNLICSFQKRNALMAHNWQKWKSRFFTCLCHKIYREEAVV